MARKTRDSLEGMNYDSFLDIVTNLIGILVILIMVIGVGARDALQASDDPSELPAEELVVSEPPTEPVSLPSLSNAEAERALQTRYQRIEKLTRSAKNASGETKRLNRSIHEMAGHIREIEQLSLAEQQERNELQLLISLAEKALDDRRSRLDDDERIELALAKQVDETREKLASLLQQKSAVDRSIGPPNILEHLPTPLARTVFGAEEHFRLLGGYLSYVPINEMEDMLERDASNKLWKFNGNNDEVTEIIGPINGYRMKYTIIRRMQRVRTPDGEVRVRPVIGLKEFVMVPESPRLGQPADLELQPGAEFTERIAALRPDETAITIWTYPDSFAEFRKLKSYLSERGFAVAARPLPNDYPIKAAPNGTRASSQ